jgi:two-component sensor histidine kinase
VSAEGKIIGASKIARDITERKRAAAAQEMLIKEMSHRLKNAFAVVNGIVGLSASSSLTPEALAQKIRERSAALALAHDPTHPGLVGKNCPICGQHSASVSALFDFLDRFSNSFRALCGNFFSGSHPGDPAGFPTS